MNTPPVPLSAIPIQISAHLIGSKKAIRFGNGPILLSPAMHELVSKAESEDELRRLLETIPLLTLSAVPAVYEPWPLPLTTRPF